ncbi:hypothetical protein FRE64_14025 [Euhalothece natronophila Z-M001]|uniref:Uncharacterized protein n=1 Tax=Euhalothece natronophila Z-M001 TaxID=522448 RepID=A0A5B8NRM6_9CHRO|nr:hypothetical protein [Euhalothece natronophila]QDZ40959.1 hypothetical protein FRE64_14025 [Euhalothece natronophila Z-M001]
MKITKKGKTLITLVSIAGIATASSSGLISQLTQSLDRAMIPKVQAEESTIRNLQQRAIPVADALAKFEAVGIVIKDGRAAVVDERKNHQALRDGVYQHEDLFLVIERGQLTSYFERGTGKLFDGDDDDDFWIEHVPGPLGPDPEPDEMPRFSVEDALQRAQPSLESRLETLQERAIPLERALARFEAVGMKIEGRRVSIIGENGVVVDQRGNRQPLRDGVYQQEDLFLVIERGQLTSYFEQGTGQLFDADDDDELFIECIGNCTGSDEMPRFQVEDALQRAQPSRGTERPLPSGL